MRNRTSFLDFRNAFPDFSVISTNDVTKVFPDLHRRRLYEWTRRGLLSNVSRGFYTFSDAPISEGVLFTIANKIYDPSYISLESALSYYGFIPEAVPQLTSISTKKTTALETYLGKFSYSSVKNSLMFGYDVKNFKIAFPEKALLDFLYLHPGVRSDSEFSGLRLNPETFKEKIRVPVLNQYLELFQNKALGVRVRKLIKYLNHA